MCPHGQEESSQKTAKLTIFLYMSLILLIFLIFYKKITSQHLFIHIYKR